MNIPMHSMVNNLHQCYQRKMINTLASALPPCLAKSWSHVILSSVCSVQICAMCAGLLWVRTGQDGNGETLPVLNDQAPRGRFWRLPHVPKACCGLQAEQSERFRTGLKMGGLFIACLLQNRSFSCDFGSPSTAWTGVIHSLAEWTTGFACNIWLTVFVMGMTWCMVSCVVAQDLAISFQALDKLQSFDQFWQSVWTVWGSRGTAPGPCHCPKRGVEKQTAKVPANQNRTGQLWTELIESNPVLHSVTKMLEACPSVVSKSPSDQFLKQRWLIETDVMRHDDRHDDKWSHQVSFVLGQPATFCVQHLWQIPVI